MTENELIQQARDGDNKAFEELVKRYESQVAATVIGMLGKGQEADDVGQEVFIRFYKALHSFREESSLGTFLTRIAMNLSLNELKRRKRRQLFFKKTEDNMTNMTTNSDDTITKHERQQLVQRAIQKLEPKFRAVIVLRLIEGYSTEETARILKIPIGTVLSRLSRAQRKLREILTPVMEEKI
ncbi:MAG: RNA polymerase sigma factor [bacterium]